ncbi:hypothetical protein EPN52_03775 [bacterium]|nr:MAG: hypothetical protein EPN52_03775 [bacterium]
MAGGARRRADPPLRLAGAAVPYVLVLRAPLRVAFSRPRCRGTGVCGHTAAGALRRAPVRGGGALTSGAARRSRDCAAGSKPRSRPRRPQPHHAARAGVGGRRADRPCGTLRALRLAHRARPDARAAAGVAQRAGAAVGGRRRVKRVLVVSNGHGEDAIALRLSRELRAREMAPELFPLVGLGPDAGAAAPLVGPRAALPSGGIVAFGNVVNIVRDLRAGLAPLFTAQVRFLRRTGARYAAALAVGDAFCCMMARLSGVPVFFVGTAKSVRVAPYGGFEANLLRGAAGVYVRDEPTARSLAGRGVPASAPGNVMMDMLEGAPPPGLAAPWLTILPGSREAAYEDARFLTRVARRLGAERALPVLISIADSVDPNRVAALLKSEGWCVGAREGYAFEACADGVCLLGWSGRVGSLLRPAALGGGGAILALGQAGTANEQAAGAGVPVVAFEPGGAHRTGWYRMRQQRLLGEALDVVEKDEERALQELRRLLDDEPRRARMGAVGRERMGAPGGAAAIAEAVARALAGAQ